MYGVCINTSNYMAACTVDQEIAVICYHLYLKFIFSRYFMLI